MTLNLVLISCLKISLTLGLCPSHAFGENLHTISPFKSYSSSINAINSNVIFPQDFNRWIWSWTWFSGATVKRCKGGVQIPQSRCNETPLCSFELPR